MNENGLNYIDLFAGAGGLSEGFIQSGYRPVAHVEMNEHAAKTIETRIAYYYLKDNGKIKSYYDYEKGKITREQLLKKIPKEVVKHLKTSRHVIQNKHGLTDEEAEKFNINSESMMKMIEIDASILVSGERKTDAELAMEKWIYNVLERSENKENRKQFFDTSKYKSYLASNNEKVKYIFENFLVDKWIREDRQLNNYVHANGIRYVMDNYIYQDKKENKDKELIETLQNITDIFLSLLTVIDSIKFHSSDYLDALEMGMKPQEGSQYWVCPIIVEYMNERFDKKLLQYIQNNEGNGMQFIAEYYAD